MKLLTVVGLLATFFIVTDAQTDECDKIDLVFIVDSSGSICDDDPTEYKDDDGRHCQNWDFVREFMNSIVSGWEIGEDYVHVAMITFGNNGVVEWDLDEYLDEDELQEAILNLHYRSQNTNTSGGLTVARTEVFTPDGGDRSNVPNVAIVITDGKSTYDSEKTIPNAERLRDESDAIVFSVGITQDIDEEELKLISSPDQELDVNYFKSATFADLGGVMDTLVNETCSQTPPTPDECSNEIDLLIIMDASDYVNVDFGGYTEWDAVVGFAQAIVQYWGMLGDGGANVGVIVYAEDAELVIEMGEETDLTTLLERIGDLQIEGGNDVNLRDALKLARDEVFTKTGGDRDDVVDLILLIAGAEPDDDPEDEADDLKDEGVAIYVIGSTTDISEASLKGISSGQQAINYEYWLLLTFDSLDSIVRSVSPSIVDFVCEGLPQPGPVPDRPEDECDLDIVIVVDSSGSIEDANPDDGSYDNWAVIKEFLETFADDLSRLGTGASRLAIVRFSTSARVDIYLDEYIGDPDGLVEAIREIPYDGHWTNTPEALDLARLEVFTEERGDRPGYPNVAVVITDGVPEIDNTGFLVEETVEAADRLKGHGSKGVKLYAIGVTTEAVINPISDETLRRISSEPQLINQNYWTRPDFRSLSSLLIDLTSDTCEPVDYKCKADIIFVLDYSSSIGHRQYEYIRDFVSSFVRDMDLAEATRVGVVLFSDDDRLGFQLNTYSDNKLASDAVLEIGYVGGWTSTSSALDYMREEMFTAANGDREDVRNVAVVITDGGSNRPDKETVIEAAKKAKAAGTHVVAIGIGGWIDVYEMNAIGSYPRDVNVVIVEDVTDLIGNKETLQALVCNKVNECDEEPCENEGTCDDGLGTYWCRCPEDYGGRNCAGGCRVAADVSFSLDSSGSVGPSNFQKEVDFVTDVIMGLGIHDDQCLVATQQFADNSVVKSYLDEFDTKEGVLNGLSFYFTSGSTNTADTLQEMRNDVFTSGDGDRSSVDNVGVVLTDGRSDDALETWQQAMENREDGINMVAVGIGDNLRTHELEAIATDGNAIYADDFDSMGDVTQRLIDAICNNVDDCNPSPCRNGGTCQDLRNSYHCSCSRDYTGNTCERECSGEIDLIFVLDASGSVRSRRFQKVVEFAIDIVNQLEFGEEKTRVGAIKFSDNADVQFQLDSYSSRQDVVAALRRVTYMRQRTHTAEALEELVQDMFQSGNGDRDDARNVAIIITNANSNINKEDTIPRAIDAKNADIHMIAVGVGNDVDVLELNGLASRPMEDNVFLARSQNDLPGLVDGVIDAFCNDEDDCDARPCDEGSCTDDFSEYICDCDDDYTGQNCDRRCTSSMDLVLVLDLSGSVDVVTTIITAFAERIIYGVNMAFQRTQVGIIIFSDDSQTWFELDTYTDKLPVLNTLSFPRAGGKTNTQSALKRLRDDLFTGSAGDRSGTDNMAIVITDGHSNVEEARTQPEAEDCRDDDIELFVVAIGENPGMNEVNGIASDPDTDHVFRVEDAGDVDDEADRLLDFLCQ